MCAVAWYPESGRCRCPQSPHAFVSTLVAIVFFGRFVCTRSRVPLNELSLLTTAGEAINLFSVAAPVRIDHFGAVCAGSHAATPMVFVRETTARPAQHWNVEPFESFEGRVSGTCPRPVASRASVCGRPSSRIGDAAAAGRARVAVDAQLLGPALVRVRGSATQLLREPEVTSELPRA
jgi:hypothetical protein